MPNRRVVVIGGGIGGLAVALLLAKQGNKVSLYEQLDSLGGRARQFTVKGYTFDMGPSWYLMPKVYEHFFDLIDVNIYNELELKKLIPAYRVFFEKQRPITLLGDLTADMRSFEKVEAGAGMALERYIEQAKRTYRLALKSFLYTNYDSATNLLNSGALTRTPKLAAATVGNLDKYISGFVKDQRLKQILGYPSVFLGTSPFDAPALYHMMSAMDLYEGVYYPIGGMHSVIDVMIRQARKLGITLYTDTPVKRIIVKAGHAEGIELASGKVIPADLVISNADLHHTETTLLEPEYQSYPDSYWQKRTPGPSALLIYLGIEGKLHQLAHHNLFFVDDWRKNFDDIFDQKTWPTPASMYISRPSATDKTIAPSGHEVISILVPLPAKSMTIQEQVELTSHYLQQFKRIIKEPDFDKRIKYQHAYAPNDFARDYHAWQNSALGLSHTLRQSAAFRPRTKSKKVDNLYYVGANTMPGIGLPMCLISAELILKRLMNDKSGSPLPQL